MWLLPWRSSGKKDKDKSPSKRKGGNSAPTSPRPQTKTFGVLLDAAPKAPGSKIPLIVEVLVKHLRETALEVEGIFRIPGSVAEVNELIRAFDEGHQINLKQYDLHATAGLLKKFFRDLPSPLIVTSLNAQIAALFRNGAHKGPIEDILARMRFVLFQLPTVNFESLKCLVSLLVDIYQHTIVNKMSLSNLVTCIVPSLDCSPAIITYSIQHFDFFFSETPAPVHSAPQVIRHSISPSNLQAMSETTLAASPRHTIALPSPSSWYSPPQPSWSQQPALRSSSEQEVQDARARRSRSPQQQATTRTSADSTGSNHRYSSSPHNVSLPPSPHHSPTLPVSPPMVSRKLSTSGGLLPPPPRSSSSPSRRNFLVDRLSVAMTTSQSTSSVQQSPHASLSLQISSSYPHSPSPTNNPPAPWQVSPRTLASSYGPDWSATHKPGLSRQPTEPLDVRPRASSYAPQPTYLFGSDGEEIGDTNNRRRSLTGRGQDPLKYSRSKITSKKEEKALVEDDREKKDRKSKERLREKDKRTASERRKFSFKSGNKENAQKKIEELQLEIQRERERTEDATLRSAEIEAQLRREESYNNALIQEIERLKRRIRSSSSARSSSTVDADDEANEPSEGESEFEAGSPASSNVPRMGSSGKLEVKIRMPFPY